MVTLRWSGVALLTAVLSMVADEADLNAWAGRSFYMAETDGYVVLFGKALPPEHELTDCRLLLRWGDASWESPLWVAAAGVVGRLPVADLPAGTSQVECELIQNGISAGTASLTVRRLPPKPNAVAFDRVSGCLITDGLPFIPVGFYCYSPVQPTLAEEEVVRGFTLMSPYQSNRPSTRDRRREYMDRCAELGMRVHYQLLSVAGGGGVYGARGSESQEQALREEIRAFRDHPALLAWYISDEPTGHGATPERLARVRAVIREEDPYHPVTVVFMRPGRAQEYRDGLDIVMVDPYPIPVRPPASAGTAVARVYADLFPHKAVWMVPQCFGGNEHWSREPTGPEVRVMSYLGLIEGARGFQYFIRHGLQGFPKSPLLWAECSRFALETAQLTPYLASHEKGPAVVADVDSVRVRAWQDRGAAVVVAVNTENRPCKVRLELPEWIADGAADVLFEDRSLETEPMVEIPRRDFLSGLAFWRSRPAPVRRGTGVEDQLGPYGVRLYRLTRDAAGEPLPTVSLHAGNLVINPSFEENVAPGVPMGCYAKVGDGRGPTYQVDARVAADGRHSLRLHTPRAGEGVGIEPCRPRVKPGQAYVFSLRARSAAVTGGRLLMRAGRESQVVDLSPRWQTFSLSCIAPEARNSKLYLMYRLESTGSAWVDVVQCVPLAPAWRGCRDAAGNWVVALEDIPDEAVVRYTLDGKAPGPDSPAYDRPITIPRSVILTLQVEAGAVTTPPLPLVIRRHAANGRIPAFETPYSSRYSGGGDGALTDGFVGSADDLHTAWQGFLGDDLAARIDLGRAVPLRRVRARFLQKVRSWIWMPVRVVLSASVDGRVYRDVAVVESPIPLDSLDEVVHAFDLDGDGEPARYVRLRAESIGVCPSWHAGAGKDCWLFADEIEINPME